MTNADELTAAIQALIPKSLDDVIRNNRENARLCLATEQELFELYSSITPGPFKEIIDDWRFISLHIWNEDREETMTFLLGNRRSNQNPRITSVIRKVDLDRGLVITNSRSLYRLGIKGEGEPPIMGLILICQAFRAWGFGRAFDVPQFILINASQIT